MALIDYLNYHRDSSIARDIDPANDALKYISDRFELNLQQRYWLAWIYSMTYSPVTTYYIYNEFPDYENVDVPRLQRWWDKNRNNLIFQTDRLRVKSNNQFVSAFTSYRDIVGGSQSTYFRSLVQPSPDITYENVMKHTGKFYTFGRFTQFIYLEMLNVLTGLPLEPTTLKLKDAESCRNGLVYAYELDEYDTHRKDKKLTPTQLNYLQGLFLEVKDKVQELGVPHSNIWNIETTLCAFKKHRLGKRYVGYYIERNRLELEKMSGSVTEGINWSPLWDFRKETYDKKWLNEL